MALIDFILNIAALLLWLNWRSAGFDPLTKSTPTTLVGTLRRAEPSKTKGWYFFIGVVALLILRALLYWQVGTSVDWMPTLKLGPISISFRTDFFSRALLFSVLSFGVTLIIFYVWLLFFSIVNGQSEDADPLQKLVRLHLDWVERWPWPIKLLLPLIFVTALWYAVNPLLARWEVIPAGKSALHRLEQASTIGLGVYLAWKYLVAGLLVLYLISSYVYLGNHVVWSFLAVTGRNMLAPFRFLPLRIGKIDFAPLFAIAAVLVASPFMEHGLTMIYRRLPL